MRLAAEKPVCKITAMKPLLAWLIAMLGCLPEGNPAEVRTNDWSSVELLSNDVVSARLLFKLSASLVDTNWLALEFDNHTPQPLRLFQISLILNGTKKDLLTGKAQGMGPVIGDPFRSIRTIPPGLHRFDHDALHSPSFMGLPPTNGLRVEVQYYFQVMLEQGRSYDAPRKNAGFAFEWRYPSAEAMAGMRRELKQLLAAHADHSKNSSRIHTLIEVPQVLEILTLDDYLPALKATSGTSIRSLLARKFAAKYSNSPPVMAYYREAFQKEPNEVWWDVVDSRVWSEVFLEPLVRGYEQDKRDYYYALAQHRAGWRNRPEYVARISAALLRHHPILQRKVRHIPKEELEQWTNAVKEAGEVGDLAVVELLKPALEDRRNARVNQGAGGWDEGRVCDRALVAILNILDGDPLAAYKQAVITDWSNEKQRWKEFDRKIRILKERLKSLPRPDKK